MKRKKMNALLEVSWFGFIVSMGIITAIIAGLYRINSTSLQKIKSTPDISVSPDVNVSPEISALGSAQK